MNYISMLLFKQVRTNNGKSILNLIFKKVFYKHLYLNKQLMLRCSLRLTSLNKHIYDDKQNKNNTVSRNIINNTVSKRESVLLRHVHGKLFTLCAAENCCAEVYLYTFKCLPFSNLFSNFVLFLLFVVIF